MSAARPRRFYPSWHTAAKAARVYASGLGWKYRVSRVRDGAYRVVRTDRRVDWGPDWAKPLGAVRVTINIGGARD